MDDSCAVCAETLDWLAYGPCGHREVCSTCVVRLRFICNDRHCCICKTESDVIFVTKALGDYTRMINDFSVLPSERREGQVGSYWYHEDTQAFFDDLDHYKMIKAMCRLSCSECDKMDEQSNDGSKKRAKFRNIEQIKGHLFHRHRLLMCSLCLEGRKVFICEQKLYSRAQLNQHINTGDSEVDGSENDRGGFTGHPMCEFCRIPFYGDNELYSHMSTEHYTCHMCQRQHPGQYEYYKNYDDLERHNAMEHGGRMSRAQRNAAFQIPTSFRYKRSNGQDHRRGRGRTFRPETSENKLSMAIQASLEMANSASSFHYPSSSSSSAQVVYDHGDIDGVDPIIQPFDSLTTTDSQPPSRYLQAMSKSRNVPLEESSFPPLPMVSRSSKNTLTDRFRRQMEVSVLNLGQASSSSRVGNLPIKKKKSRGPLPSSSSSTQSKPMTNNAPVSSSSYVQIKPAISSGPSTSGHVSPTSARPAVGQETSSSSSILSKPMTNNVPVSLSSSVQIKPAISSGPSTSGYVSSTPAWPAIGQGLVSAGSSLSSSRNSGGTSSISNYSSSPNLAESRSFDSFESQFPPVSATQMRKSSTSSQPSLNVKDVHTANKSLVEKMRVTLEFDEDKYNAFKEISGQYRQGLIHTVEYLAYVQQFGLSDLILDLARLCPDAQKQKELFETYNANMRSNGGSLQNGRENGNLHLKDNSSSKKGKGKRADAEEIHSKSSLADSILTSVRELQSSYRPFEVEVEELSKDGYCAAKGKSMVMVEQEQAELGSANQIKTKVKGKSGSSSAAGSNQIIRDDSGGGGSKHRKKTSKFHRIHLGDGSAEAYLNARKSDSDPDPELMVDSSNGNVNLAKGLPVRGVWRSGGGHKLLFTAPKDIRK